VSVAHGPLSAAGKLTIVDATHAETVPETNDGGWDHERADAQPTEEVDIAMENVCCSTYSFGELAR
jgi:hypothetical protein